MTFGVFGLALVAFALRRLWVFVANLLAARHSNEIVDDLRRGY